MAKKATGIEGVILAAGYGRRMRPITGEIPKAMLPVAGVPLIRIILAKMARAGAGRVHVNLHHLGGVIRSGIADAGTDLVWHEEEELLDTGGGLGNMAGSLGGARTIILCNGDICSSIDLAEVLEVHEAGGGLITLVLMKDQEGGRCPPPSTAIDGEGRVVRIGTERDIAGAAGATFGYTGIAALSAAALDHFPCGEKAGLIGIIRSMIADRYGSVLGWDASLGASPPLWGQTGDPRSYLDIHRRILVGAERFDPLLPPPGIPLRAGEGSVIDPSAEWKGFLDVGAGSVIEKDTMLEDCVVLGGAKVRAGTELSSAVVGKNAVLEVGG